MKFEPPVYYISVLETGFVYLVDLKKAIQFKGTAADVSLIKALQKHDDDSETEILVAKVADKGSRCYAAYQFATEKEFEAWRLA